MNVLKKQSFLMLVMFYMTSIGEYLDIFYVKLRKLECIKKSVFLYMILVFSCFLRFCMSFVYY